MNVKKRKVRGFPRRRAAPRATPQGVVEHLRFQLLRRPSEFVFTLTNACAGVCRADLM